MLEIHYPMCMALDLSLNGTGIAISSKPNYKHTFLIKTKKIKDHMKKILYIKKEIFRLGMEYDVDKIFIEGQAYSARGRSIISIAQLHGVIMYCLMKKKIPFEIIPPTVVKKYITGKGNAKKSLILKFLYKKFNIDIDQEDEADAMAVLITGNKNWKDWRKIRGK